MVAIQKTLLSSPSMGHWCHQQPVGWTWLEAGCVHHDIPSLGTLFLHCACVSFNVRPALDMIERKWSSGFSWGELQWIKFWTSVDRLDTWRASSHPPFAAGSRSWASASAARTEFTTRINEPS